ncbi:MAG: 4-hydroxy-3-methylbut-2-enyl diphosphate reductase [Gammaproteobacteria bacterium]|nr:4-hydroxy-3-methylbut-2-enyl diphosphate reductase [Gammaproteobacteria bacterium]
MQILLANPRGFCAGVDRAIGIVERALELFGAPIYVRHEVVHNKFVVNGLREKGAVFVKELDEVPRGNTVIFSAHGVSQAVRSDAEARGLQVFDATCPLVTKVHMEVIRHQKAGHDVILIGHQGHPEVEGTLGQYDNHAKGEIFLVESIEDVEALAVKDSKNLAYVTQTTLSVDDTSPIIDALRQRFPDIMGPKKDDICYATQNRQEAVKLMVDKVDLVLIVGSPNSSNSNRLCEVAEKHGVPARLIDNETQIQAEWLADKAVVGVSAGASAPEILVKRVIDHLVDNYGGVVEEQHGREENIVFPLPKSLKELAAT